MRLILKDGTVFEGESFGAPPAGGSASGEVVFNTGMVGYVESLTDPSYAGQILVLTYPLVGNYGVPSYASAKGGSALGGKASEGKPVQPPFESTKIQVAGLVVAEYSENYSHHSAKRSLSDWLKRFDVPALTGVDTRALTKKLREHGVMLGRLQAANPVRALASDKTGFIDPNKENLAARVSIKKPETYGPSTGSTGLTTGPLGPGYVKTIILIDCGMKQNILRSLLARGVKVVRVPWDYDFANDEFDGVVISNGPGDPQMCATTVENIKRAMLHGKPILGICLGNQLLSLAAGGSTYKLKYGHRSQNQPCINIESKSCYITSQNHGYAVVAKSLPSDWKVWFVNANDGSVEGIKHKTKPWKAVQFHPEASPGPTDTAWIFDEFVNEIRNPKFEIRKK